MEQHSGGTNETLKQQTQRVVLNKRGQERSVSCQENYLCFVSSHKSLLERLRQVFCVLGLLSLIFSSSLVGLALARDSARRPCQHVRQ